MSGRVDIGPAEPSLIHVSGFAIDLAREELRSPGGEVLSLRPQAFRVLRYLALNAGRLVPRKELVDAVWPGVCVTDDSLVQCIGDIRRVLDDSQHRIVKTVPRRGYLFAAEPEPEPESAPRPRPPGRSLAWFVALAFALAGIAWYAFSRNAPPDPSAVERLPDRPSLAVLRFKSADSGDASIVAAGLAEELIGELARNVDLRVIARHSSFSLSGRDLPVPEMAGKLGVRYLVDGSLRRDRDNLRISIQLLDGNDGRVVWSVVQDTGASRLPATRDALVRRIAGSVQSTMRVTEERRILRRPPKNLDVYTLTLRAIALKHQFAAEAYRAGRASCEQAIAIDPDYAPAWVYLGFINAIDSANSISGERNLAEMGEALAQINRGIELDPNLPVAYQALSLALAWTPGRGNEALAAAQRAVELGPSDADNLMFLARAQVESGLVEAAVKTIEEARSLYPIPPSYFLGNHARVMWASRQYERAIAEARESLQKTPQFLFARLELLVSLAESGRLDEAGAEGAAILKQMPHADTAFFGAQFRRAPELYARRTAAAAAAGIPSPPGMPGDKAGGPIPGSAAATPAGARR